MRENKPRQWFGLKDAILVTLVVGLSVGWWLERREHYESLERLRVELGSEQLLNSKNEARYLQGVLNRVQERLANEHGISLTYGTEGFFGTEGVWMRPMDPLPVEPPVVRYISPPTAADYGFHPMKEDLEKRGLIAD